MPDLQRAKPLPALRFKTRFSATTSFPARGLHAVCRREEIPDAAARMACRLHLFILPEGMQVRTQISLQQTSIDDSASEWRDQVSDRIKAHRARRRQGEDTALKFNFDLEPGLDFHPDPHEELKRIRALRRDEARTQQVVSASDFCETEAPEIELSAVEPEVPQPAEEISADLEILDPVETESPKEIIFSFSNIIEFPGRILAARAKRSEAAGSERNMVSEESEADAAQLRIFEAEATDTTVHPDGPIPPTGWAGLHLDEDKPVKTQVQDFELPLQVAPIEKRAACAAADVVLVSLGCILFSIVQYCLTSHVPAGRNLAVFVVVPSLILWAIYHGLFLSLGKLTPGMRWASLGICNFEDDHATRKQRVARVFAGVLSLVSLGMGYLWVLFDEDSIGWHDRMTRTYLREL